MNLVVENHHLRKVLGEREAVKLIADIGFDGIDYSFYHLPEDDTLLTREDYKEYALELREYAEGLGVRFMQAHAPLTYPYSKRDELPKQKEEIIRSMEIAALLGVPTIVVHTIKCPKDIDVNAINLAFYRELRPYAEKFGIKIGVENLFIRSKDNTTFTGRLGTPEEMNAFIDELDSDAFTVCLDVGHAALTGCEPQDFIRGMSAERLTALHIQDNERKDDSHMLPFLGKLDWNEITSALAAINYNSDLTFEILHYIDKFPPELLPAALTLAYNVGRRLINDIETKK